MTKRKTQVEPIRKDLPVYSISVAARLLDIHPRTLRIYEDEGLLKPERVGNRRLYSANDLTWIGCLRRMIHNDGISIPGIKKLLRYAPCHEIADCPEEVHCSCDAVVDKAIPRSLRLAGDPDGERRAKEMDLAKRKQKSRDVSGREGNSGKGKKNK